MARFYRPVRRDQQFLMPPDMREWLPADHLVWFVIDAVDVLDTTALHRRRRRGGVGTAGYDPTMLLALLIYAYCRGVRSSRQIERLCATDVAFRVLCAQDVPDHVTIARFRAEQGEVFTSLFAQVLQVAGRAGLARFGTVAIDGTKIAGNASLQANRDAGWLAAEAARLVADAQRVDAAEDAVDDRGDDGHHRLPPALRDPTRRAERIAAAAAELAAQAEEQQAAEQARRQRADQRIQQIQDGGTVLGRIPDGPDRLAEARVRYEREVARQQAKLDRRAARIAAGGTAGRHAKPVDEHRDVVRTRHTLQAAEQAEAARLAREQAGEPAVTADPPWRPGRRRRPAGRAGRVANVTDPQSRMMPTRCGFLQGYNAQLAVTADQLIVAVSVSQHTTDHAAFQPMMAAAQVAAAELHALTGNPDHRIGTVLADAGYASHDNLTAAGPDRLIALGTRHDQARAARDQPAAGPPDPTASPRQAMHHRLRTPDGAQLYKRRGATVEPAIGNLKKILNRFSRRGLTAARDELHLAATAFNLLKIYRAAA